MPSLLVNQLFLAQQKIGNHESLTVTLLSGAVGAILGVIVSSILASRLKKREMRYQIYKDFLAELNERFLNYDRKERVIFGNWAAFGTTNVDQFKDLAIKTHLELTQLSFSNAAFLKSNDHLLTNVEKNLLSSSNWSMAHGQMEKLATEAGLKLKASIPLSDYADAFMYDLIALWDYFDDFAIGVSMVNKRLMKFVLPGRINLTLANKQQKKQVLKNSSERKRSREMMQQKMMQQRIRDKVESHPND
ncbi:MAG: hypothetical protein ACOYEL_06390 [Saccharofermentanales bacterium]|jgi:hypothetical protein